MQLVTFLKNVRRQARLESRMKRIKLLNARATEAKNDAQLAVFKKEGARRAAEINYLALRNEADLEDKPDWQDGHDAMRAAVLSGSRGSKESKKIMGAALAMGAGPAAETATAE